MATKLLKLFFTILVVFCTQNISKAQTPTEELEEQARTNIFDLNFEKAKKQLENNNSNTSLYLKSYNLFIENLFIGGKDNYTKFEIITDKSVEIIEKSKADNQSYNYLAELYFQKAVLKLFNKDYFSGLYSFVEAFKYYEKANLLNPNNIETIKLSALFNIIAGITPEAGQVLLSPFGIKGDVKLGIKQLNKYLNLAKQNKKYYVEAFAITKLLATFLKEDYPEMQVPKPEFEISKNKLNVFTDALLNYIDNNYSTIDSKITYLKSNGLSQIPYLYYLSGIVNTLNNKEKAINNLKIFLQKNKSKHFTKSAYWQLARIYILNGDTILFQKYKKLTKENGGEYSEADKQAQLESSEPKIPNVFLLKARLLFDAGKYVEAQNYLVDKNNFKFIKTKVEQTEQYYRLSRTYNKLKMNDKAIKYYNLVIEQNAEPKRYFAAYSALQVGIIYQEEKKIEEARKYFNLALKLNIGEYKDDIKQSANLRLKEISK